MDNQKEWSRTKTTLVMLLKQEIQELQPTVVQMREESLLKNVAKRKVIYNITRQGEIELVYALLALAEYYLGKGLLDCCIRSLRQAREFRAIGDAGYLLGTALLKKGEKEEAVHWLSGCLNEEWIEPSVQHKTTAKLQAMTQLQQLYFALGQRDKLLQISYKKVQLTQQNKVGNEGNFHALALLDMAHIHEALGESQLALQKIQGAITLFQSNGNEPAKLVQSWRKRASLMAALGKRDFVHGNYTKALQVIENHPSCVNFQAQADILEEFIESHILV